MQISGSRGSKSNLYFIDLNICIPKFDLLKPITFLIDTGSEITTINYGDALILGIHDVTGNPIISTGIDGAPVDNIPIENCAIYYYLENSIYWEFLKVIHVSKPVITTKNEDAIMGMPSLLGMDFLQRYKICFEKHSVILEK